MLRFGKQTPILTSQSHHHASYELAQLTNNENEMAENKEAFSTSLSYPHNPTSLQPLKVVVL